MYAFITNGYLQQLLQGAWITVQLALASLLLGLVLAMLFALGESAKKVWLNRPISGLISVLRGLPELVVLFFIYFGLGTLLSELFHHYVAVSTFSIGMIALGLIFAAYASQVLRGAFKAVPKGQIEAAQALGLNPARVWLVVKWPLAWRFALPGLGNLWLVVLKDTALVSLIGLSELMNRAQLAASSTAKPFTFYLGAAFIYLLLTSLSQLLLSYATRKADRHLRFET